MPTAVERALAQYIDASLKLDGIDGIDTQAGFINSAGKIDAEFLKLALPETVDLSHKYQSQFAPQFAAIGDAFVQLGGNFTGIADFGLVAEAFIPTASRDTGPNSDFLGLDATLRTDGADLAVFGHGFVALDTVADGAGFRTAVGQLGDGSVLKLSTDMTASAAAFETLGTDLVKLGGNADTNKTPLDAAYRKLGATLENISSEFTTLSTDFGGLGADMRAFGGANSVTSGVKASSVVTNASFGADLLKLDHAFLALDSGFSQIGAPLATILLNELSLSTPT